MAYPPWQTAGEVSQPAHPEAPLHAALLENYFQFLSISLDLSKNILTS